MADAFAASISFASEVQSHSGELGDLKVKFKGSDQGKDFCNVEFDIDRRTHFLVNPTFGYFQKPNTFEIGYALTDFKPLNKMDLLERLTFGRVHRYDKALWQNYV